MQPPATTTQKVPLVTKFAFGSGDFGTAVTSGVIGFFRLIFLTDIAGIPPATAGLILLVGRVWDAINDPLVGAFSDRLNTRWGRRRPMFLFGAIPFALSYMLLFFVPPLGETGKIIYYIVAGLLFDTFFTIVNVPYTALTAEMTNDYNERTSLNSFRFAFSIVGSLVAVILHGVVINSLKPTLGITGAYAVFAVITGVLSGVPYLFAFWGTYERPEVAAQQQKEPPLSFGEGIKQTFASRSFRYVVGVYIFAWLTLMTVQTTLTYYLKYWLAREDLTLPVVLAVQLSAFVFLFIWSKVCDRIGKKRVYIIGMFFWIGVSLALYSLPRNVSDLTITVLGALAGVGVAVAYLVPWAMLPDVIEEDELHTGRRREGAFYGYFALLQKFGAAAGSGLIGLYLSFSGYITPREGDPTAIVQPDSALNAIRLLLGPVPAVLLIIGIYFAYKFPITKEQHERTLQTLKQRKEVSA